MRFYIGLFALFAVLTLCLPMIGGFDSFKAAIPPQPSLPASSATEKAEAPQAAKEIATEVAEKAAERRKEEKAAEEDATKAKPYKNADDEFKILNKASGEVENVSRKDYVRGAVCAEMPPRFHTQALAAQALAANTYALRCKKEQEKKRDPALLGADFACDPDNWHGYVTEAQAKKRFGEKFTVYWGKICRAADMGGDYVAVYGGEPIVAAYHSLSGGKTESASNVWQGNAPYLAPAESFGDTLAEGFESSAVFTAAEVKEILLSENPKISLNKNCKKWFDITKHSPSGYVLEVKCGGKALSGIDMRRVFKLRSSNFTIGCDGKSFTFTVKGYGHGVGLSQYGADYMARQGADFKEIAMHYYTGCELQKIA
ncbi:MAG: stage II sporulation protein D [Hydrogenoanaerobacterium sp.]